MNTAAYAIVFLLALESNNVKIIHSSCQISDSNNDLCNSASTTNCQCKQDNFNGLIVTLNTLRAQNKHLYMIPTSSDGTPNLDKIRSITTYSSNKLLSVDVDYTLQQAYLYDKGRQLIYKDPNYSNGLSGYHNWKHLHRGISPANVKLAVDWISHNIYWTDPYFKWIMVQSLLSNDESMYHVLIYNNLEGPHALALDPIEGLLFWSDIGRFTKIEVSSLSGRSRKTLIASMLLQPTSMVTDRVARRIYFTDSSRGTIETVTYEGRERTIVFSRKINILSDIAVYKDYLYVTASLDGEMYFLNRTNWKQLHKIPKTDDISFTGVAVFHPDAQPTSVKPHCVNYGCEQICVTEKDGATCLCKDGYTLNQDTKTCSLSNTYMQRGVIYSDESNICIMDIRSLADFVFSPKCVLYTKGTNYMALDTDQRNIFFSNDTAIYWAGLDNLELRRLTEPKGIISGMAWDGYDRNLYWTEENTGLIWRVSAESENANVFLEGLNKPRDIMILPHERRVYWISDRNGSTIETSNINGSNHQIILDSNHLDEPRSLSYDSYKKRIYFMDNGKVKSCNLDGSDQKIMLTLREPNDAKNLEIYKGYALMTASYNQNSRVRSASIEARLFTSFAMFSKKISAIKVFDGTLRQNETENALCSVDNEDCSTLCFPMPDGRKCGCEYGVDLKEGSSKDCSDKNFSGLFLTSDTVMTNRGNLYMLPTTPEGTPSLDDIQSIVTNPPFIKLLSVDVDHTLQQAYLYSKHRHLIYKDPNCSFDLSGYHNWTYLHRGISPGSVKLAVDWISHNIYWTDPYFKWIMVQSLLSNDVSMYHVLIYNNLEGPHALALDPMEGCMGHARNTFNAKIANNTTQLDINLLFWSDIGRLAKIEVSSLSGRSRKTLISTNLLQPTSIAADQVARRIYFTDTSRRTIETVTYEGRDRKLVFSTSISVLTDLAVYKDYLYVTASLDGEVYFLNKTNGNQLHQITKAIETSFYAVTVFLPEAQPVSTKAHCVNYGCEQICVTEKDSATCLCKDGYTLNQDRKTCSLSNTYLQRGVIYSDESNICIMDIRSLADFVFSPKCVLYTKGTNYMALDTDQRNIFFSNDTAIYWAGVDNLELHRLTEPKGIISGMAWDGYDRNLYWTEDNTGLIWRVSAESENANVFLDGLNKPRDIMILPHERRVYWISDKNGSTIETSNINGSYHQIILDSNHLVDPWSLSYDPYRKRIYFMDNGKVKSCNLDGSDQKIILTLLEPKDTTNLEIYKGYALMTVRLGQNTKLRSASIEARLFTSLAMYSKKISAIKVFDGTLR